MVQTPLLRYTHIDLYGVTSDRDQLGVRLRYQSVAAKGSRIRLSMATALPRC